MRKQVALLGAVIALAAGSACSAQESDDPAPELAGRGQTMTTVKPSRQDLSNSLSLQGQVTMRPVYGLVAPVTGEVRYTAVEPGPRVQKAPVRVASIRVKGKKPQHITLPAGSTFATRS